MIDKILYPIELAGDIVFMLYDHLVELTGDFAVILIGIMAMVVILYVIMIFHVAWEDVTRNR